MGEKIIPAKWKQEYLWYYHHHHVLLLRTWEQPRVDFRDTSERGKRDPSTSLRTGLKFFCQVFLPVSLLFYHTATTLCHGDVKLGWFCLVSDCEHIVLIINKIGPCLEQLHLNGCDFTPVLVWNSLRNKTLLLLGK